MKYETGICANCGAEMGLHHFESPHHCPKNGIEEPNLDKPQLFEECYFQDSGILKLEQMAPELVKALEELIYDAKEWLDYSTLQIESFDGNERELQADIANQVSNRITKAESLLKKLKQ